MAQRKSLLVLGASEYQLETITTAQRLGYRVVCSDNVPNNLGHPIADKSYAVDTTDREGILWVAREEKVDGVIAPCTDVAVPTAAYVAERMALIGPPLASVEIVCDKIAFREFLRVKGFAAPRFLTLPRDLPRSISMFSSGPCIIKPDRSSGSKGVVVLSSLDELQARLPETLAFSPTRRALLEQFIEGFQGTCEGIVHGGRVVVACLLDRQTVGPPYVTTAGHRVPTSLAPEVQHKVVDCIDSLWQTLDVREAVFDCDFVVSNGEVTVLEMTPRLGGNCISRLLHKASGFHFAEYAIRLACGEQPLPPKSLELKPMAVIIFGSGAAGRLEYDVDELRSLEKTEWIDSVKMDVAAGAEVQPFINGRNRIGECFLKGSNREDVIAKSEEVSSRLAIAVARGAQ